MTDTAIKVNRASKQFKLYHNAITGPIKEFLFFWKGHKYYETFTAVDDVSLEIKKGEVVGIVGPNGAGKTTLLKMIAGLLPVNRGTIEVNGTITALLALGVGMNQEFSGRENIYYSALLLGMPKGEVLRKMPAIIEFAELGKFIDKPIRTYSSGMKARLLFATSMSVDPDILIVDEALATGDAYFIQKSTRRIREFVRSGATILFVSHNLRQIEQLCERAYFMAGGKILDEGDPSRVIHSYSQWAFKRKTNRLAGEQDPDLLLVQGTGDIIVTDVTLKNAAGEETKAFYSGEPMAMELHYRSFLKESVPVGLVMNIFDSHNHDYISQVSTFTQVDSFKEPVKKTKIDLEGEGKIVVDFQPALLLNNDYSFRIVLVNDDTPELIYCEYKNAAPFHISRRDNALLERGGDAIFWHPFQISVTGTK